jgi:rhomboid protease GluP
MNDSNSSQVRPLSATSCNIPLVTGVLIIFNVAVFLFNAGTKPSLAEKYGLSAALIVQSSQYYRIFTYAFVHLGWWHILANMLTLFSIGPHIENEYGSLKLLLLTIWGVPLSGLVFVLLTW